MAEIVSELVNPYLEDGRSKPGVCVFDCELKMERFENSLLLAHGHWSRQTSPVLGKWLDGRNWSLALVIQILLLH